jgi:hypothetical protein
VPSNPPKSAFASLRNAEQLKMKESGTGYSGIEETVTRPYSVEFIASSGTNR